MGPLRPALKCYDLLLRPRPKNHSVSFPPFFGPPVIAVCSWFLVLLVFEVHRGLVLQRAVEPVAVVNRFDVFKNHPPDLLLGPGGTVWQRLTLERAPKRFHRGIIVTVGSATHARQKSVPL